MCLDYLMAILFDVPSENSEIAYLIIIIRAASAKLLM